MVSYSFPTIVKEYYNVTLEKNLIPTKRSKIQKTKTQFLLYHIIV
jgi:hypothetical protein